MNTSEAILAAADARKEGLLGKYPMASQVLAEEVYRLRGVLSDLITGDVGRQTMLKLGDGQGTDTDDGRAWMRAAALVRHNAKVRGAP